MILELFGKAMTCDFNKMSYGNSVIYMIKNDYLI